MLLAAQVGNYYSDLRDERFESALALVHQRFSTNTFPTWDLAQPFRMICHNGEINTLRGNVNWMAARRHTMESEILGEDLDTIWPLIPKVNPIPPASIMPWNCWSWGVIRWPMR